MATMELWFEAGETTLSVRRFSAREAASELFSVAVWAVSSDHDIDLDALVGRAAAFQLSGDAASGGLFGRRFAGVCNHAELIRSEPTGLSTYLFQIAPALWLLTQRRNLRIFQHLSAPDIVERVLAEHRISRAWEIDRGAYPALEYKVQYDEDDLSFVRRILSEAGITFFLDDGGEDGTKLLLCDKPQAREPRPAIAFTDSPNDARIGAWASDVGIRSEAHAASVTLRDYDFRNPSFALAARAHEAEDNALLEKYYFRPGSFFAETGKPSATTPIADDKGTNRGEMKNGLAAAERALAAERVLAKTVSFVSNVADLRPGVVFSIALHPRAELSESEALLVIETNAEGTVDKPWSVTCRACFAKWPYFPRLVEGKPRISGVQSAVVVGPKGQEIHTDEHGRVRVQMAWDREGAFDDKSSSWVRVNQGWAGTGYGVITLPRVGQEVLIGFMDGDPELPMVVGRVFNSKNLVPYKLPEHKTVSTWRTESTPGGGGYNEILFDDAKGQERVGIRAERDLRKLVQRDETITVSRNRKKLVKGDEIEKTAGEHISWVGGDRKRLVRGDEVERTEGNVRIKVGKNLETWVVGQRREKMEQNAHTVIGKDQRIQVGGSRSLTVLGEHHEKVTGRYALASDDEVHIQAGTKLVIDAMDLTIAGMGGFIRIDPSGVTIKGNMVMINSGGTGPERGKGAKPEKPEEPENVELEMPEVDDVSKTGIT